MSFCERSYSFKREAAALALRRWKSRDEVRFPNRNLERSPPLSQGRRPPLKRILGGGRGDEPGAHRPLPLVAKPKTAFAVAGLAPPELSPVLNDQDERAHVMYAFAYVTCAKLGLLKLEPNELKETFQPNDQDDEVSPNCCYVAVLLLCVKYETVRLIASVQLLRRYYVLNVPYLTDLANLGHIRVYGGLYGY